MGGGVGREPLIQNTAALTPVALSIPVSREEGRNVDVYLVRWYKEVNVKASLQSL